VPRICSIGLIGSSPSDRPRRLRSFSRHTRVCVWISGRSNPIFSLLCAAVIRVFPPEAKEGFPMAIRLSLRPFESTDRHCIAGYLCRYYLRSYINFPVAFRLMHTPLFHRRHNERRPMMEIGPRVIEGPFPSAQACRCGRRGLHAFTFSPVRRNPMKIPPRQPVSLSVGALTKKLTLQCNREAWESL
jgi:hypothetical protein